MIKQLLSALLIVIFLYLFQGCAIVKQSVFLQNTEISGPINQPPIHITEGEKNHTFTFSPSIYVNTKNSLSGHVDGHTNVNNMGVFQIDTVFNSDGTKGYKESVADKYQYNGRNFSWNLPDVQVGFQVNADLSDHVALTGGFNYSEANRNKLINGNIGIGFFSEKNGSAVRFDIGLLFQDMFYQTSSVVITTVQPFSGSEKNYISFFKDNNNSTATDFYGTFTYNSANKELPVNYYFSLSYFGQTVLNYQPRNANLEQFPFSDTQINEDTRGEIYTSFLSFTPGIYKEFEDWGRLSLGVRLLKETKIKNSTESFFVVPVVQFDMLF